MASKSAEFFENGTNTQFEWVLGKYQDALQAKADSKSSKSETLLKLDKWYQNELPKKIKSRGKEPHLTHEEIVQTIKWKLARGIFRPRLKDLVQMNTPRVVMQETKKAFRAIWKRNDLESAMGALINLKGVGPAMASAVLAAGSPEVAPFMADECLLSMPEVEGIDYTMKEYMKLVDKTNKCVERLNSQGGNWTPHKVELAIWTQYVARDLKPEILDDMPGRHEREVPSEPVPVEPRINGDQENGVSSNGGQEVQNGEAEQNGDSEEVSEAEVPAVNGDSVPEVEPPLENGSGGYDTYAVPQHYPAFSDTQDVNTPEFSTPGVDLVSAVTKRPLEEVEEAEEAVVPEFKRSRDEVGDNTELSPLEAATSAALAVNEGTNGVQQQQPQALHTGAD